MRFSAAPLAIAAVLSVSAGPAWAGDEPLYEPAPEWIEATPVDASAKDSSSPYLLLGQQARIEKGRLWTYAEYVVALDSPEALNQFGTLQASWLPDKGDLIIHEASLIRDGKTVSIIGDDKKFEVLRRERRLESRMLDGQLTATMPVSGAQLGDRLRLAYSTTLSDQAMGDDVQWQARLMTKPVPLETGYLQVTWPKDMNVKTEVTGGVEIPQPASNGKDMVWRVEMPLDELDDRPTSAPSRYTLTPGIQVTTYSDWKSVSRSFAPHYDVTGSIPSGSALAGEVEKIRKASSDPRERLALSLELVQDQVSYLLNGLNGGNYLPQMPEETWEKRFGDCKAKSVLLHAILQELGINSGVVLVRSRGGDALPVLAPMPGNFDHMIVRAEVDGETFWLDGTVTGTRIDTMYEVPRFFYALPLTETGSDLVEMEERALRSPDRAVKLTIDQTAGLLVPGLFDIEVQYRGSMGSRWRAVAELDDLEQQENAVDNAVMSLLSGAEVTDYTVTYDIAQGLGTVKAQGLVDTGFKRERAVFEMAPPTQPARSVAFNADRARKAWRDVPLRLNGPSYYTTDLQVLLPDEPTEFGVKGKLDVAETIGGVQIASKGALEGNRFALNQSVRTVAREVAAADIPTAKRAITRLKRALPKVRSGREITREWDYLGKNAKALAPLQAAFDKVLADAEEDDEKVYAHSYRGQFREKIFDHKGALEDIEAAIDLERSTSLLWSRAGLLREMGDLKGALADLEEIEALEPKGETYSDQIEILSLLGRKEDALYLAEDYRGLGRNEMYEDVVLATAMGWAGQAKEGLQVLEDRKAVRPGDGSLLNAICWHAGTWNIVGEKEMATCTEAVERAEYSPSVLDSRALAYYRMGDLEKAKADLDAALLLEPGLTESRLLRGVVRVAQGDKKGREDIKLALRMEPSLKDTYKAWGIPF
jgi:tetratricopeptide (TPR) repeat protein